MTLSEIWIDLSLQGHGSDKGSVHSYIEVYEKLLAPYRKTANHILEIGLFKGDSLRMWEQYFTGRVFGIDCSETPHGGLADLRPMIAEGTHNISIIDATDPIAIKRFRECSVFDVIIEDAGHHIDQQIDLYHKWKPYIAEGGIYIIEDIQDIYATRHLFESIDPEKKVEIIDRRHIKERYDDVLVVIRALLKLVR